MLAIRNWLGELITKALLLHRFCMYSFVMGGADFVARYSKQNKAWETLFLLDLSRMVSKKSLEVLLNWICKWCLLAQSSAFMALKQTDKVQGFVIDVWAHVWIHPTVSMILCLVSQDCLVSMWLQHVKHMKHSVSELSFMTCCQLPEYLCPSDGPCNTDHAGEH